MRHFETGSELRSAVLLPEGNEDEGEIQIDILNSLPSRERRKDRASAYVLSDGDVVFQPRKVERSEVKR
jgi:hypothetical protein